METLEAQAEDFAAIVYAEPGALGLIANIVAALMIATENMLDPPFSAAAVTLSGEFHGNLYAAPLLYLCS